MDTIMKGKAFKYGDDVNTDVIFPGKYTYTITDPEEMGKHALEDLDPEFVTKVKPGDVIVAGKNFGCGSSREQATVCIKTVGVSAIIAKSFARIYYRNAINTGLPVIISPETDEINPEDELEIHLTEGVIKNHTTGKEHRFEPLPEFVMEILGNGGLIGHTKKKLGIE